MLFDTELKRLLPGVLHSVPLSSKTGLHPAKGDSVRSELRFVAQSYADCTGFTDLFCHEKAQKIQKLHRRVFILPQKGTKAT